MKRKSTITQYPDVPENFPSVSLIIPFEQKMTSTAGLHAILATVISKEEEKLMQRFPAAEAQPVIAKLNSLVRNLEGNKRHLSIGIFVSPHASRVYYFNYSDPEMQNDDRA
jgi:hypothetical protein